MVCSEKGGKLLGKLNYYMKKVIKTLKRDNSKDGRKAHNDSMLIKVGRIRQNSWAHEKLKAADIYIDETELVHIQNKHGKELGTIGMEPFDFVCHIVSNYNEIYDDKGDYLLVVKRENVSNFAAIRLSHEQDSYKIKTAAPIKTKQLLSKKLLCANVH